MAYKSNEKKTAGFRTIEADIKNGAVDRAAPVLLYGDEIFLTNHYEHLLTKIFCGTDGDIPASLTELDVSVFHGGETSDDAIAAALDTFPLAAKNRVVVVKNHPSLSTEGKSALADSFTNIPETTRLIFTATSVNRTRALYKAIDKHGTVYEFARLSDFDLRAFAQKRFNSMRIRISPENLDAFCRATGYLEKDSDKDLFHVQNEAKKVATFVFGDGRGEITAEDISECMPDVLRVDVFGMLDAISTGDKSRAVTLLENGFASGESPFGILSLITTQFEIMLGYKELRAKGRAISEIVSVLGERSDWRVKRLGGFSERFEEAELRRILGRLYAAEKSIRSGDISERLALTVIFADI